MTATSEPAGGRTIRFDAALYALGGRTVLRLPEAASEQLPSRGQVAVEGTINGRPFETVVEPDGAAGHWMSIDPQLQQDAAVRAGDTVTIAIEPRKAWPEPDVPPDFAVALATAPEEIQAVWREITPMARWEWVRWVNATRNPDTRKRRVEVSMSKMAGGKRRPCCFNLAACTDPELSKNGRLVERASFVSPSQANAESSG